MMRRLSHWAWDADRPLARWDWPGLPLRVVVFGVWVISQLADHP